MVEQLTAAKATRVLDSQRLQGAPNTGLTLGDCRLDGVTTPSIIRYTQVRRREHVLVNGRLARSLV